MMSLSEAFLSAHEKVCKVLSLKADALNLKADALNLKAEALSLKAEAVP